jgi:hypothetical protein
MGSARADSSSIRLRAVNIEIITAADGDALETALRAFLRAGGEKTLVQIDYVAFGASLLAIVTYTDG